jgi:hypothetical protein
MFDWSTNDLGSIKIGPVAMKGRASDLQRIAEMATPGLRALMLQALTMPEETAQPLIAPQLYLSATLRDYGVGVDPEGIFARILVARGVKSSE